MYKAAASMAFLGAAGATSPVLKPYQYVPDVRESTAATNFVSLGHGAGA